MAHHSYTRLYCVLIFVLFAVSLHKAANHYCVNELTLSLSLDDFYHRDEYIIPEIPHASENDKVQYRRCRWSVSANSRREGQQMVLEGLPATQNSSLSKGGSRLNITSSSYTKKTVLPGMFHVVPMNSSKNFLVEAKWDPSTQAEIIANLRILMPLPGLCSGDMLSFNGSCYAVSSLEQNVTDAMTSITGDAQLASFSSMAEIREFIAANNEKLNEFPYRRPLSLGQPIRLGIFCNASSSAALSLVRAEIGCKLQTVPDIQFTFKTATRGPCVSLMVDPNSEDDVINLVDCDTPLLSLIRFPDTAYTRRQPLDLSLQSCNPSEELSKLLANEYLAGPDTERAYLTTIQRIKSHSPNRTSQRWVGVTTEAGLKGYASSRKQILIFAFAIVTIASLIGAYFIILYIYHGNCHNDYLLSIRTPIHV